MVIFSKVTIGLDVADHSIEAIALKKGGKKGKVVLKRRITLGEGIIEHGRVLDEVKLKQALYLLMEGGKKDPSFPDADIYVGLPDSQVYTFVYKYPKVKQDEIESNVLSDIKKEVPLIADDIVISTAIKPDKVSNGVLAQAMVTSRTVIQEWTKIFTDLDWPVKGFDSELLAAFRGIKFDYPDSNIALVDIGYDSTRVNIFSSVGLSGARSISFASYKINESIKEETNLSLEVIENLKCKEGFNSKRASFKKALISGYESLISQVKETLDYFDSEMDIKVAEILLVGGGSMTPGVPELFEKNLALPSKLGVPESVGDDLPMYFVEAVGLSWRGLSGIGAKDELFFEYMGPNVAKRKKSPVGTNNDTEKKKDTEKIEIMQKKEKKTPRKTFYKLSNKTKKELDEQKKIQSKKFLLQRLLSDKRKKLQRFLVLFTEPMIGSRDSALFQPVSGLFVSIKSQGESVSKPNKKRKISKKELKRIQKNRVDYLRQIEEKQKRQKQVIEKKKLLNKTKKSTKAKTRKPKDVAK